MNVYHKKQTVLMLLLLSLSLVYCYAQNAFVTWNFEQSSLVPSHGNGYLSTIGGISSEFITGYTGTGTGGIGLQTKAYPVQGTSNCLAGIQAMVSTSGKSNIMISWHQRNSNTAANRFCLQYTIDGSNWLSFSANESNAINVNTVTNEDSGFDNGLYIIDAGSTWFSRSANFESLSQVNNNPNFGIRFVSAFVYGTSEYGAANPASNYTTVGTCRFDNITLKGQETQTISLNNGWNICSFNTLSSDLSCTSIFYDLINTNQLIKVHNESGQAFEYLYPISQWIDNIGLISQTEGYYIKVNGQCQLSVTGNAVSLPLNIPLITGWNLISYPYHQSKPAFTLLQNLVNNQYLVKVMNETGQAIEYLPGVGWIDNIHNFVPGEGYAIKVNQNTELVYPEDNLYCEHSACREFVAPQVVERASCSFTNGKNFYSEQPVNCTCKLNDHNGRSSEDACRTEQKATSRMLEVRNNACNTINNRYFTKNWSGYGYKHHNFYILLNDNLKATLREGDEIAIFDRDNCVAVTTVNWNESYISLIASMKEDDSEVYKGFITGHSFAIRIYTGHTEYSNIPYHLVSGSSVFEPFASTAIQINPLRVNEERLNPESTIIKSIYPNPFNPITTITYSLSKEDDINIDIFNIKGQIVKTLVSELQKTGNHQIYWQGKDSNEKTVSSGVYFCRLKTSDKLIYKKLIMIK